MSRTRALTALMVGLVLISTAGPFVAMAHMDAFAIVFWRMALSALAFAAWALARGEFKGMGPHLPRLALGATLLTAHFALWIKAFDLTDFASNLLLLVIQPVTAVAMGPLWGERPTPSAWRAVGLAAVGLAIVAGGDFALGPRALLGDAMCVVGSAAITWYFAVTRAPRSALPLATFMAATFGFGALLLAPFVFTAEAPAMPGSAAAWGWVAALVLLTTVAGHGLMNLAARTTTVFEVNVVVVLEPAIAVALGWVLFGAAMTPLQAVGGLVLAAAVLVGLGGATDGAQSTDGEQAGNVPPAPEVERR